MNEICQLINLTKKYLTKYDYDKVSEYCDKILEINSESGFALRFKAISYFQKEDYKKAIPYFQKLLKLYPQNNDIYSLAFLYEKIGENYQALSCYNQIVNDVFLDEKRNRLLTKMGRYDILIKEYDEKLASLNAFENKIDPRILVLMEEKAVFHYRNEDYEEAYRLFEEISDYYPTVLKTITHPMKRCQEWYNALHYYLNEYDEPVEFFNNFFILDEYDDGWTNKLNHNISRGDPFVFGDLLIEFNPDNTRLLERYGDFAEYRYPEYSLNCYHKVLEIEPDNKKVVDKMITIYSREYSKDKALKLIDSKLKYSSIRNDLLRQKIELLESMMLYSEAVKTYDNYFKHATRTDKHFTSMKVNHIICMELYALDLYNQNKTEQAYNLLKDICVSYKKINNFPGKQVAISWYEDVLKDAIEKSEDNPEKFFDIFYTPDEKQTIIWINKIDSITSQFEPQKLIGNKSYYDILSDKNPENYELAISEAQKYYTGIQRPKIALPLFDRVLKIDPENNEVLNQKFGMLITDRQYDEAYEMLTKIEVDYPVIAYSLKTLADFYINKKDCERAKYCLKLILNHDFDYSILKKLKGIWNKSNDKQSQKECPYYMDWIKQINYKHDKETCPHCGNELLPIKYGVVMTYDSGFKTGKYYASENIKTKKNRPTDYCNHCKKEYYNGFCGINLNEDNTELTWYTKQILNWLIHYLEENKKITTKQLGKAFYKEFSINQEEYEALLVKLQAINFIECKEDTINLWSGYVKFKSSLNELYHFSTKIFNNKKELEEYSNTIRNNKKYSDKGEYIEDVRICLMASSWQYSYEFATELFKGNERDLSCDGDFEADAWDTAMEVGFIC